MSIDLRDLAKQRASKPPLGVRPRSVWLQERAEVLSHAINDYVQGGFIGGGHRHTVMTWMRELTDILEELGRNETLR